MSSAKNALALSRRRNAPAQGKHQPSTATPAGKKTLSVRQAADGENIDPRGEESQKTSAANHKHRHRSDKGSDKTDTAELQQQFLKEIAEKKTDDLRLGVTGRIIARLFCPFGDLNDPLHWGLRKRAGVRLPKEQKDAARLGADILAAFDDLPALISKYGLLYVETKLTKARNAVRGVDTFKMRNLMMRCRAWAISPQDLNDKSKCGWANEEMAKLLFPDHLLFNADLVKAYLDSDVHPSEADIPCLVWEGGDSDNVAGFLRGELLLQGGAGLMHGMQAATTGYSAPSNTARKHHIDAVTEVFIIYVICLVRFALSNEKQFTPEGSEGFDYFKFYKTIAEEIAEFKKAGADGAGELAMDDLLEAWDNRYIFASSRKSVVGAATDAEREAVSQEYRTDRRAKWATHAELMLAARIEADAVEDEEQEGEQPGQPQDALQGDERQHPDKISLFLPDDVDDGKSIASATGSDDEKRSRSRSRVSPTCNSASPSPSPSSSPVRKRARNEDKDAEAPKEKKRIARRL